MERSTECYNIRVEENELCDFPSTTTLKNDPPKNVAIEEVREGQKLRKSHTRISSGQMKSPASGGARICGNLMNIVTFAEPEMRTGCFCDPGTFIAANWGCPCCRCSSRSPASHSQMQSTSDQDIDFCCCSQNSIQSEQTLTTSSKCRCARQLEGTSEDLLPSYSDEDSEDLVSLDSSDSENRGLEMPDPEVLQNSRQSTSSSSSGVASSESSAYSSFSDSGSMGLDTPFVPPPGTWYAPPPCFYPPDACSACPQSNFLGAQQQTPPPMTTFNPFLCGSSINDMFQTQTVYMTDYRPILSGGNPAPFCGGGCCCSPEPLATSCWDSECLPSAGCPAPCCCPPDTTCCNGLSGDMCGGAYGTGGICSSDSPYFLLGQPSPGFCCHLPCGTNIYPTCGP
ncbi:uncharacterized protein LOC108053855 isoform X2 [Drosophila rhopaloa]|uniref:Uncharacterized protein n=2 Tax=Drosophila rhopaloa TaxID=1041015 RepID=A0ABM5JA90_DRORH|nr:uncharacterized protein LOC108053855 isoform X2 [Drosophila rhopaloa]